MKNKIIYYSREIFDLFIINIFWIFYCFSHNQQNDEIIFLITLSLAQVVFLVITRVYKTGWEYINLYHFSILYLSSFLAIATLGTYNYFYKNEAQNLTWIYAATFFSLSFILTLHRLYWYFKLNPEYIRKKIGDRSVIMYGAGTVTMHLLQDLQTGDLIGKYHLAAIVDNDPEKIGSRIGPYKIENGNDIQKIIEKYKAREIWLTMPVNSGFMQNLFKKLQKYSLLYKVVPRKYEHIIPDIRSLRIEDLIQRPEIKLSQEPLTKIFSGKRILITGAAGSIGREITIQIAALNPRRLILLDQNEHGIFELDRKYSGNENIQCHIADITNKKRILEIFSSEKPEVIFHAAAYKHVPMMEKNFKAAIETNILGTFALLTSAIEMLETRKPGSEFKFINISTDKAVSPENIMGITKRIAELMVYNIFRKYQTKWNCNAVSVRFGNVLGSSGSVVPLFWEQIQNGGPLTVTHPDMERFFMTIPEAVRLVLHASIEARHEDILALDMGKPVKIVELAERLILLSGYTPHKDIKIEFTEIRPGEKLKEEVFWTKNSTQTDNPYIFRSSEELSVININQLIANIKTEIENKHSLSWWKEYLKQYLNPEKPRKRKS
jgi:FlaA1/EpsC-like NDP-sugar epimerase